MNMIQSSETQLRELERRLAEQSQELAQLRRIISQVPGTSAFKIVEVHEKIAEMTRNLFKSEVSIHQETDAEIDDQYFVVKAIASGEIQEIVDQKRRWHELTGEISPEFAGLYRLSITVK
jgi:hypothetical protein